MFLVFVPILLLAVLPVHTVANAESYQPVDYVEGPLTNEDLKAI
jgi:hypothetical protein